MGYLTRWRIVAVAVNDWSVSLTQVTPGNGDGDEHGIDRSGTTAVAVIVSLWPARRRAVTVKAPPAFVRARNVRLPMRTRT